MVIIVIVVVVVVIVVVIVGHVLDVKQLYVIVNGESTGM